MLFVSSPPFIRCYQDVFLNHTRAPRTAFHLKPKEEMDQPLPCERERMPRPFRRHSRSPNGPATSPPPSEASRAPSTPCEQDADFQSLVGLDNIWKPLTLFLPGTEILGPNDGRKPACFQHAVCTLQRIT